MAGAEQSIIAGPVLGPAPDFPHLSPELGDLPLVRLDFSCNRVSRIPVSFCRLRHLQVILLDSNPLQSPPAQVSGWARWTPGRDVIWQHLGGRSWGNAFVSLRQNCASPA